MSVVVSAKVPKELRERARRYGISISKVVRRTLEAEVAKRPRRRNFVLRLTRSAINSREEWRKKTWSGLCVKAEKEGNCPTFLMPRLSSTS